MTLVLISCHQTGHKTFTDIVITSPNCITLLEGNKISHDTLTEAFDSVMTLTDILMTSPNYTIVVEVKSHDSQCQKCQFNVMLTNKAC